jgi:peptide deformylase
MIHERLKMGHPLLMSSAIAVAEHEFDTPELHQLVADLFETQEHYRGVGLAAPQIGVAKRVAVLGFEHNERYKNKAPVPKQVLINPELEFLDDERIEDWEGCVSLPHLRAPVPRAAKIKCIYRDVAGNRHELIAEGFHARIIQHEFDHLCGIIFPTRIINFKKFGFEDSLPEYAGKN